ncbi:MAG: DUF4397 domain-containing protein [Bacteroidetes bacterium]|nr:DUF4397 domain-containing protein [Bacteroidota bacterium]
MKKLYLLSLLLFAAVATFAQTARVQVIHNAADAAAQSVDVWLNNSKLLSDFAFRQATPFVDAPAGTPITISIQPPGSTSASNPIWSQTYTLEAGNTYVLVANGLVSQGNYNPFKPFDVYVKPMAKEASSSGNTTDVLVFHGATDAPTVDVVETGAGAGTVIDNMAYGQFAGYLSLPTADYVLDVRDETGTVTVARYAAPLQTLGLGGQALTVLASGFLNPADNSNGPAFGLYVALASGGELIPLPLYTPPSARIQVIHNAADAAAEQVDVWINDSKAVANFAFRTATPFVDVPGNTPLTVAVQPPGSGSASNPLWSQTFTLEPGKSYVLVANGLINQNAYNPFKPFDVYVKPDAKEASASTNTTDVLVFHGATDAPTVDVVEVGAGAGTIIDNMAYGAFAGYLSLPTADYTLDVRDETGTVTVARYLAPLQTLGLGGQALTVVASGFLNPAANNNGPAFGLFVALASGGDLIPLPFVSPNARIQVIHNAADAAAAQVDVWINESKAINSFAFRTATPFIDAPANTPLTVAIKPAGSTTPENPLWSETYTLEPYNAYVLVANGLVNQNGYNPFKPFNIYVKPGAKEASAGANTTDVLVFHGSTDAPVVDVVEVGVGAGTIIDNFAYGEFAGYLSLPTADYALAVRDETGTVTVATFGAPLQTLGLGGQALTVLASGFLNPDANSNGPAFGLYAALPSGGALIPLPVVTSLAERMDNNLRLYPNPASSKVQVSFELRNNDLVNAEIYNIAGSLIKTLPLGGYSEGPHQVSMDVSDLKAGVYMLQLRTATSAQTRKLYITR